MANEQYFSAENMRGIYAGAAGGTATAITLTLSPAPGAYFEGMLVCFKATAASTGATTVNVNSLGAKTLQMKGAAIAANDLDNNGTYLMVYDGTNFQVVTGL